MQKIIGEILVAVLSVVSIAPESTEPAICLECYDSRERKIQELFAKYKLQNVRLPEKANAHLAGHP